MTSTTAADVRKSLRGVTDSRYSGKVTHYRGIQYATVAERFAKPVLIEEWPGKFTDFTRFGPRCPQPAIDLRRLMRIPKELPQNDPDEEDELRCANLNVTCPTEPGSVKLPVLLWIYGGSQMRSFGSASQKLGDPGPLVAQSIEQGKPIVLVTVHYRLNIFAFGGTEGEVNLGLQDQRVAISWIKRHISILGGDPENITVGGQSAGAIYAHALLASGSNTTVQRAILASACLYTNPPQPEKRCFGILGLMEGNLQLMEMERGNNNPGESVAATLAGAPVERMIQSLKDLDITSMWMWPEAGLKTWDNDEKVFGKLKGLMIGDTEYESIIYAHEMSKTTPSNIARCFETVPPEAGKKLAEAYGVSDTDATASQKAALDFLSDARFGYPAEAIAHRVNKAGGYAYQYSYDQMNPFTKSTDVRSHHAVDLFAIFGGYDGFVNEEMKQVGSVLRKTWIDFINGDEPWNKEKIFAYGPEGMTGELTEDEAIPRRRQQHYEVLKEVGHNICQEVWLKIMSAIATATND